jgi:hypothetical protein
MQVTIDKANSAWPLFAKFGWSDTKGPEAARKPAKRSALSSHMFSLYKLAQIIIMAMYTQKRSLRRNDVQHDASATAETSDSWDQRTRHKRNP